MQQMIAFVVVVHASGVHNDRRTPERLAHPTLSNLHELRINRAAM